MESEPLLTSPAPSAVVPSGGGDVATLRLYGVRWYLLAVYSWMAFMQSMNWACWSPITTSAKQHYGWTDNTMGTPQRR